MQFTTKDLSPQIAPFVESIFHYQNFQPDHSVERVVPTGHHFILFELDNITRHTFDPDSLEPTADFEKAWVSAVRQEHLSISAHQDSEMLVIQLKPYGGYPLFHQPMELFANRVIPADQLFDGQLIALRESFCDANTAELKLQMAEEWVTDRLNPSLAPPPEFIQLVDRLFEDPACKLADINSDYPSSQKHLIDQFKRYVGVTPKVLQRVIRFNELLGQIQAARSLAWSDIANLCGYSDQSHFIREFKTFSGMNPKEFIKLGFDEQEPNFFPLDRASDD